MDPLNSLHPFQGMNVFQFAATSFAPRTTPKPEPLDEPLLFPPVSQPNPTNTTFSQTTMQSLIDPNTSCNIPVPNQETQFATGPAQKTNNFLTRSSKIARVTNHSLGEQCYYRNSILKRRRLFDSIRIYYLYGYEKWRLEDKTNGTLPRKSSRAFETASLMLRHGFWLNMDKRIIGNIPGVFVGDIFLSRIEMCVTGLHGQVRAGIDYVLAKLGSNYEPVATSLVVSDGYEGVDDGDVIVYTCHGGVDDRQEQNMDQKLDSENLALERSMFHGIGVRVIRGLKLGVGKVYVYDGMYKIINTWTAIGISGFRVYKFTLVRIEGQGELWSKVMKLASSFKVPTSEFPIRGYISHDLANDRGRFLVYVYNDIDQDRSPLEYKYLKTTIFPRYVYEHDSGKGCDCVGGCEDNCLCAVKNGDGFAYDYNGTLLRGKPLVFECGSHCKCSSSCRNRVTQNGIKNRFQVFKLYETAWGVRSFDLIKAGSFICEYAGITITREQVQMVTMNGDNLIYAGRFAEKWKEWGDLSELVCDYVCPTNPSIPPLDFAIDVSTSRNLASYIRRSLTPNVFVQHVLYDHNNVTFPHLMLFALENIPPMRELCLDYGWRRNGRQS